MLVVGVAIGPWVLTELGLKFPFGDGSANERLSRLQKEYASLRKELAAAQAEAQRQDTVAARLQDAQRERDLAKAALTKTRAVLREQRAIAERETAARGKNAADNKRLVGQLTKLRHDLETRRAAEIAADAAAKRQIEESKRGAQEALRREPALGAKPGSGDRFRDRMAGGNECLRCPVMVVLPAGNFIMGSNIGEHTEKPPHLVIIAEPFAVSKFEITFSQWGACVAGGGCIRTKNPSDFNWGRGQRPVINVSWHDANEYTAWLSRITSKRYRLLSEAEWEYAARAGKQTRFTWGDRIKPAGKAMANCAGCGSRWDNMRTAPVGKFPPNAWGLHDMHGNVWEWVQDSWHSDYQGAPKDGRVWKGGGTKLRVLRGGSWGFIPNLSRSANRSWSQPVSRSSDVGFRVARMLTP